MGEVCWRSQAALRVCLCLDCLSRCLWERSVGVVRPLYVFVCVLIAYHAVCGRGLLA